MITQRWIAALFVLISSLWATAVSAAEWNVMIVTWRGCEEACQGFQDHFQQAGLDVKFLLRDAARNVSTLPTILEEAREVDVDLIVTWGTSVTRGIAGTLSDLGDTDFNTDIPQVFMIVADPVGAGIVNSLDATGRTNVTGTFNRVPETVTIATIRRYLPTFRHLGMLYNSSEPNSALKQSEMAGLSNKLGFSLTSIDIDLLGGRQGIAPGMDQLRAAEVDFVYLGSSSLLRSNADVVASAALASGLPLLTPYEDMVRNGQALISIAARYYDVGRLAGKLAERVLTEGSDPGQLSVARMSDFAVTVNMSFARDVGALPPIEILQFAEIVE
ncbi:ABC transporter substrate-binding protein [Candidatus Halocynthiibacter alkanivorans]|uniref:ABC transporter substrate-binding protein n=1 Tax=Candidatus Halocynthiibacter alkanivorans TaxID=2267619 RepID=UPI000DF2F144|nr:ABC transporter substrate-binding protein [Candidatus Halocynthiibacter alkanivorans]